MTSAGNRSSNQNWSKAYFVPLRKEALFKRAECIYFSFGDLISLYIQQSKLNVVNEQSSGFVDLKMVLNIPYLWLYTKLFILNIPNNWYNMVTIGTLLAEGKLAKIRETELGRYISFFESSYKDNLAHSEQVKNSFPRWSIISGYYAMHDITKLLLAKKFRLKVELEVHATTIKALADLIRSKNLLAMLETGYKEFLFLANDLAEAKSQRVKVQYYTGTDFMKEEYRKRAEEFLKNTGIPYIEKILRLL